MTQAVYGVPIAGRPAPPAAGWVRFAAMPHRIVIVAALAVLATSLIAGCGADDHPNEPRPAAPVELTAKVDDRRVDIEPSEFGAGLAVLTVSNQSDDPVQIAVDGPTAAAGQVIEPGAVGNLKASFEEGTYEVTPGEESDARPATLEVGPPRPSSQNELLLP